MFPLCYSQIGAHIKHRVQELGHGCSALVTKAGALQCSPSDVYTKKELIECARRVSEKVTADLLGLRVFPISVCLSSACSLSSQAWVTLPFPFAYRSPMFWLHSRLGIVVPRPALQQPVLCLVSLLTSTPPSCSLLLAHLTVRVLKLLLTTGEQGTARREGGWRGPKEDWAGGWDS